MTPGDGQLTVGWDASTDGPVSEYKVYAIYLTLPYFLPSGLGPSIVVLLMLGSMFAIGAVLVDIIRCWLCPIRKGHGEGLGN